MAKDTPLSDRNLVIYEIYVRNHGPNGTFADVESDLPRIRSMGVDIVWFMPIHPIGQKNKKGELGCPYSISDYREVNPEYGSREDFKRLIQKAHQLGLKVMIDVVYNHTSHDSILARQHPEWFYQDDAGKPVPRVPDWADVVDLKHLQPGLTEYLIETLQGWAKFGVDGFRCDVASLVPVHFWKQAREAVAKVKPDVIWLAESVHGGFVEELRLKGFEAWSDSEIYQAFDLTYDYDIWPLWQKVVTEELPIKRYLEMLRFQNCIYPNNFVKMRCVENHDQLRIMKITKNTNQALAWTAFQAFNKGAFLIYGGQESAETHRPSLFDIDKVNWKNYELQGFLTHLTKLKKEPEVMNGQFILTNDGEPAIQACWYTQTSSLLGIFNVNQKHGKMDVALPDGKYTNLIDQNEIVVQNGKIEIPETSFVVRYEAESLPRAFASELID